MKGIGITSLELIVTVSYTHLDVYKRQPSGRQIDSQTISKDTGHISVILNLKMLHPMPADSVFMLESWYGSTPLRHSQQISSDTKVCIAFIRHVQCAKIKYGK